MTIKSPRKQYLPFSQVTPGSLSAQKVGGTGSQSSSVSCLSLYSHLAARINSPCFCSHAVVQWTMSSSLGLQDSERKHHLYSLERGPCLYILNIFISSEEVTIVPTQNFIATNSDRQICFDSFCHFFLHLTFLGSLIFSAKEEQVPLCHLE